MAAKRDQGCWSTEVNRSEQGGSPGSQEGKPHPGVHQPQHSQTDEGGDCPAVFSIGAASPGVLCAVWGTKSYSELQNYDHVEF